MAKVLHALDEVHSLYQYTEGHLFGTDSVLLAGAVECRRNEVGCELGAGCGAVSILLGLHKAYRLVWAVEIQPKYAALTAENAALCALSDRIRAVEGDFKEIEKLVPEKCDFVFANPPYRKVSSGGSLETQERAVARTELCCELDDVCRAASRILKDKGRLTLVYPMERLTDLFCSLRAAGLEPKRLTPVTPVRGKAATLALVCAIKGASPGLAVRAAFAVQEADGARSAECRILYENGVLNMREERR